MLETVEFPSVWQNVKQKKWDELKEWAEKNPERVNTKWCEHSLINKVAEAWVGAGTEVDATAISVPLKICLKHLTDINE
eukprot:3581994-Amphidinium_carterae.1